MIPINLQGAFLRVKGALFNVSRFNNGSIYYLDVFLDLLIFLVVGVVSVQYQHKNYLIFGCMICLTFSKHQMLLSYQMLIENQMDGLITQQFTEQCYNEQSSMYDLIIKQTLWAQSSLKRPTYISEETTEKGTVILLSLSVVAIYRLQQIPMQRGFKQ